MTSRKHRRPTAPSSQVPAPGAPDGDLLFSYGTLQLESVQLATFGRTLTGFMDALPGYSRSMIRIEDAEVVGKSRTAEHPIISYTGRAADVVDGTVFRITAEELRRADAYEVPAYRRVAVGLASGLTAWAYVDARRAPPDRE